MKSEKVWRLFVCPPVLQVSVLILKVQSVCVGMEAVGESAAVALEVGQVTPSQLGNVCLRQYLSNRSLGKKSSAYISCCVDRVHYIYYRCFSV